MQSMDRGALPAQSRPSYRQQSRTRLSYNQEIKCPSAAAAVSKAEAFGLSSERDSCIALDPEVIVLRHTFRGILHFSQPDDGRDATYKISAYSRTWHAGARLHRSATNVKEEFFASDTFCIVTDAISDGILYRSGKRAKQALCLAEQRTAALR